MLYGTLGAENRTTPPPGIPDSLTEATVDQLQPRELGVARHDRIELGARQHLLSDEAQRLLEVRRRHYGRRLATGWRLTPVPLPLCTLCTRCTL